ncbi:MAG: leucine-rich repeat domain-containing protein [Bacteroides sp.]|nr:leucine-rich repeat domain-containing protein [Bacteroides sp.]MCM1084772.1 leucine-rich repeat domain-containing protein [Bacteroides sp.]
MGLAALVLSLFPLQAQESESNAPQILEFHCSSESVTSLDVSGCTALTTLSCSDNRLTALDVSGCTALTSLSCFSNYLTRLDVSGCTALTTLTCGDNQLTSLEVSGCTALTNLDCNSNRLTALDVSGCTALTNLTCYFNQLTSLDVSGCTALTYLYCNSNQLTSLDVSGCTVLRHLNCDGNRIPLARLYEVYSQHPSWSSFDANQFDAVPLSVNQPFDLSSEWILGQNTSTYKVLDVNGNELPFGYWAENEFVFQFEEPLSYRLVLENSFLGKTVSFTWGVSVFEKTENYRMVRVASNNMEWGTASITGNGTYEEGSEATVTATPKSGYRFVNWTKDGKEFAAGAVHTFAVTEDIELTANFEEDPNHVGNEEQTKDNFRVWAQDRVIHLSADKGAVQVYNMAGQCIYNGHATAIPVRNGGLYIVRIGRNSYKVMVR